MTEENVCKVVLDTVDVNEAEFRALLVDLEVTARVLDPGTEQWSCDRVEYTGSHAALVELIGMCWGDEDLFEFIEC